MKERLWTRDFILLGWVNLLMFGSFFFLLPTLPLYVTEELGGRENQVGLIIGVFAIAAIIARPWTGMLLDQWGRRKLMLVSLVLFVFATAGYFGAVTLILLLILRLVHGAIFGMASTASGTVAADLVPASRRGEGLGYFGTFIILAMVAGPSVGLKLADFGYGYLFAGSLTTALLGLVLALFIRYPGNSGTGRVDFRISPNQWKQLIDKGSIPFAASLVGLAVIFGGITSFISLYAAELGDPGLAGGYFFVYALALVLARVVAGRVHDRWGPDTVVYPGLVFYAVGLIFLGLAEGMFLFYTAAAFIGLGYGSIQPSVQAIIIQQAPENRRGAATATFFMALDLGIGAGSFLLGFVSQWLGYRGMYLFCLLFALLSATQYWRARKGSLREERGGGLQRTGS
ncbi:putative MFS family arabinose efflux permease [Melghirimyces profundicolus]|uniref:Putative MFS family arabinose efflux permease n=1 Tax=Melghirimyces profundicolus TaxID=1242148 RepID=A0A2T6BTC7_9BACL|nr:MFS transporter [Melghirimyces profundicolus]PTX59314.1 putative MFS family arabinose efflux permease [Melghirimyces profundicolus]